MRKILVLLLIALLPLRGWSADTMTINMAASQLALHATTAGQHDLMPKQCPMMFEAGASQTADSAAADAGEQGCQACQLCMSLAPYEVWIAKALSLKSIVISMPMANCFVSADPAPALRPPIF